MSKNAIIMTNEQLVRVTKKCLLHGHEEFDSQFQTKRLIEQSQLDKQFDSSSSSKSSQQ